MSGAGNTAEYMDYHNSGLLPGSHHIIYIEMVSAQRSWSISFLPSSSTTTSWISMSFAAGPPSAVLIVRLHGPVPSNAWPVLDKINRSVWEKYTQQWTFLSEDMCLNWAGGGRGKVLAKVVATPKHMRWSYMYNYCLAGSTVKYKPWVLPLCIGSEEGVGF